VVGDVELEPPHDAASAIETSSMKRTYGFTG
jgi:hypothetical protein